jgi:hypothetical protein
MEKIQRPNFIDFFGNVQGVRLFPAKPLFRLDPHVQLYFFVGATNPLVIPGITPHFA